MNQIFENPIKIEWKKGFTRDLVEKVAKQEDHVEWTDNERAVFARSSGQIVIVSSGEAERILSLVEDVGPLLDNPERVVLSQVRRQLEEKIDEKGFEVFPDPEAGEFVVTKPEDYCMVCSPPPDAYERVQTGDEVFCEDHTEEDLRRQMRAMDERTPDPKPIGAEEVEPDE